MPSHGAAIDCGVFADDAVRSNLNGRCLAAIANILWRATNDREWIYLGSGTNAGAPVNNDIVVQDGTVGDLNVRSDDSERTDLDVIANPSAIGDDRRRMYISGHVIYPSEINALMTASATFTSLTHASAVYFHTLARLWILRSRYSRVSPGRTGFRNLALSMVMK